LIAKGDINGIPLAERAINEYWDAAPAEARASGLRFVQQDVIDLRDAVTGDHRNFGDTVNALHRKEAGKLIEPLRALPNFGRLARHYQANSGHGGCQN
jgi:hypothetical protein